MSASKLAFLVWITVVVPNDAMSAPAQKCRCALRSRIARQPWPSTAL